MNPGYFRGDYGLKISRTQAEVFGLRYGEF
jgi:hypothetical protein